MERVCGLRSIKDWEELWDPTISISLGIVTSETDLAGSEEDGWDWIGRGTASWEWGFCSRWEEEVEGNEFEEGGGVDAGTVEEVEEGMGDGVEEDLEFAESGGGEFFDEEGIGAGEGVEEDGFFDIFISDSILEVVEAMEGEGLLEEDVFDWEVSEASSWEEEEGWDSFAFSARGKERLMLVESWEGIEGEGGDFNSEDFAGCLKDSVERGGGRGGKEYKRELGLLGELVFVVEEVEEADVFSEVEEEAEEAEEAEEEEEEEEGFWADSLWEGCSAASFRESFLFPAEMDPEEGEGVSDKGEVPLEDWLNLDLGLPFFFEGLERPFLKLGSEKRKSGWSPKEERGFCCWLSL